MVGHVLLIVINLRPIRLTIFTAIVLHLVGLITLKACPCLSQVVLHRKSLLLESLNLLLVTQVAAQRDFYHI